MLKTNSKRRATETSGKALKIKVKVIVTRAHIAVIDPPVTEVMLLLTDHERTFVTDDGPTGYRCVHEQVPLGTLDFRGRIVISAGLLPRVLALLDEGGVDVEIDDQRVCTRRHAVEDGTLKGLDPWKRALIEAILEAPLGQIKVRGPREAIEICHLLCYAFARARILIAVPTVKQAVGLHRALESHHGERVGLAAGGVRRKGRSLLVATFGSVPADTAGKWDILILPNGQDSTGRGAIEMIPRMDFPRIYACVPSNPRIDRLVGLRLEEIAGPVIRTLDRAEKPLNVVMVPTPRCAVANARTALERKRALYWNNRARNQTIADVAQAVVARNVKALRRYGVPKRNILKTTSDGFPRVAILVESTEHARELMMLLPGWTLCAMTTTDDVETIATTCALKTTDGERIVTKRAATTMPGVETIATKRARTSTDDVEKSAGSATKRAMKTTNKINEAQTKKSSKVSQAELKTNKTVKMKGKKTGAGTQSEIKTATINTKRKKKSQTGIKTITKDIDTISLIVTTTYAATHDIRADIVIRATGTDSPLRVKNFPAPDLDKAHEALLIDFQDSGELNAVQNTERRLHDYGRRSMNVIAAQVAHQDNETSERNSWDSQLTGTSQVELVAKPAQQSGLIPAPSRLARGRK